MIRRSRRLPAALIALAALLAGGCPAPHRNGASTVPSTGPGLDPSGRGVAVYVTSQDGDRIKAHPPVSFADPVPDAAVTVTVDERTRYQTMAGFGASFLEAGLVTLNTLPDPGQQEAVLKALFDPRTGAGFSVMKTVIGATDFQSARQAWFTYDDTPGDTALAHFSIARDLGPDGVLTYIMRARQAGGQFLLQAPMDYPPDWILTTVEDREHQNVDPRYYPLLARYYLRYLREYEKQGVHVDYLSLFNEPEVYTKIPAKDLNVLLRDHVGPLFRQEHVTTGIMATEVPTRESTMEYYPPILGDPKTRSFIDVLGYHGYPGNGAEFVARLHREVPDLPMWMTELCCLHDPQAPDPGPRSYADGDVWAGQIIADLQAGASAWIYWNMILDETGGPWLVSEVHEDGDPNSQSAVVHIDKKTHEVVYTALYYYLSHFSRFVRPGSVRIGAEVADPGRVTSVAFQRTDGAIVTELVNSGTAATTAGVDWHGRRLVYDLPKKSITTLVWPG